MSHTPIATPVRFDQVSAGDVLQFVRVFRGFEYPGGEMKTYTETVARVTAKTVFLTSGMRLLLSRWADAEVKRVTPTTGDAAQQAEISEIGAAVARAVTADHPAIIAAMSRKRTNLT